uniref:USP48 domain-containing protein n=1 Tax=Ditylenchus dipsaci TaxID=166011 RepID=A0A915E5U9_9BILA
MTRPVYVTQHSQLTLMSEPTESSFSGIIQGDMAAAEQGPLQIVESESSSDEYSSGESTDESETLSDESEEVEARPKKKKISSLQPSSSKMSASVPVKKIKLEDFEERGCQEDQVGELDDVAPQSLDLRNPSLKKAMVDKSLEGYVGGAMDRAIIRPSFHLAIHQCPICVAQQEVQVPLVVEFGSKEYALCLIQYRNFLRKTWLSTIQWHTAKSKETLPLLDRGGQSLHFLGGYSSYQQHQVTSIPITTTSGLSLSPRPGTSSSMDFEYSADSSPSTSSRNNNNIANINNIASNAVNRKRKHELSQEPSECSHIDGISPTLLQTNSSASGEANSDSRSDLNGNDDCVIVNEVNGKPSKFNDDLLCEHGRKPDFCRQKGVVAPMGVGMLRTNYTDYFEAIPCSTPECSECVENYFSDRTKQATCLSLLEAIQNEILKTMRSIERRRNWQPQELGIIYTRVLCPKFVQKFASRLDPRICQECLLCEHNAPYMVLDEQESEKCTAGFPITYEEWNDLLRVYTKHSPSYPRPIEIKLATNGNYDFFCAICNMQYLEEEDNKRYCYPEGGDIYIKLQGDGGEEQETKPHLHQ